MRQASGRRLTAGVGYTILDPATSCIGLENPRTVTVRVLANEQPGPYQKGIALVSARIIRCFEGGRVDVIDDEVLEITKR